MGTTDLGLNVYFLPTFQFHFVPMFCMHALLFQYVDLRLVRNAIPVSDSMIFSELRQ